MLKQKFSSKFLTQIWHFPWSNYEKSSLRANFECHKIFFLDLKSKIRFHSFVGLDLEYRLSTHNMVISLELKATKNQEWKKLKIPCWVPFWNNRLHLLTTWFYSNSILLMRNFIMWVQKLVTLRNDDFRNQILIF